MDFGRNYAANLVWSLVEMCILFSGDDMNSIWMENVQMPSFSRLDTDMKTEVLIIGGGLAGLLCAYALKLEGIPYVLLESDRVCCGISANTTAKITSQHGLVYSRILRKYGKEAARAYWEIQEKALRTLQGMAEDIPCDAQDVEHTIYASEDLPALTKEAEALHALEIPFAYSDAPPLPVPTVGAISFPHQAQFHPLKFAAGIASGLNIYEHTSVREFRKGAVITDSGVIRAEKTIIATHFPILNKHGGYFLKLYQERSYVLAVEYANSVHGMYLAAEKGGFSFRNHGGALLVGSGGHRTGKKSNGWRGLEDLVQKVYPQGRIVARWANQDCMTLDGIPYIGCYSNETPNLYVATGFNKWGMTNAMASAMILKDLVQGRKSPYASLFFPGRSMQHAQLAVNIMESAVHLMKPARPRCPHLSCALNWNPQEHSWDCPCHGSRFSEEGKLLDNPATGDIPQ